MKKNGKLLLRLLDLAAVALILLLLCAFAAAVVAPRVLGLTAYAVTSGSMAPTLARGDLLFVAPAGLEDISPGDVVAFYQGAGVVTHRVYAIDPQTGTFRTRADSSNQLDPGWVDGGDLIGRAAYRLPLLGYFSILRDGEETD